MSYVDISSYDPVFDDPTLSDVETEGQRLCPLCKSITISGIRRVFTHHRNHEALISSSTSCDSCFLLASTLVETPSLRWRSKIRPSRSSIGSQFYRMTHIFDSNKVVNDQSAVRIQDSRIRPEGASPNDANRHGLNQLWVTCGTLSEEFRMYATSVRTSRKWRIPRPMNSNSGSVTSLDLVRIWNQTCLKKHKCKIDQSVLPTRVIDVGPRDGSQKPFLHVTKGETGHWISLSHCWGKQPIVKTKLANFKSMCRRISLQSLPKTFQDSVVLTRQLGIRYLWIDSICIIQDSPADWEAEAAKMAEVYKRAYLTVVAASAEDSHEGFFMNRPAPEYAPAGLVFSNAGALVKVFEGADSRPGGRTPRYGQRESAIVDTRAWCLQEEALSPRLLKYNRTHMSWHCSDWADIHEDGRQQYHYDNWNRIPATLELADDGKRPHIWHMILANYTKRHMTFGKDKLPALAGVATEFHQRTGDEYLAGMWRSQLPLGLMWRTRLDDHGVYDASEVPQHERSAKYRAPSWSWACVDGPIDFSICTSDLPYDSETSITILNASITTKGAGPFGEVLAGSLGVRGRLKVADCGNDITPPRGRLGEDKYYITEVIDPSSSSVESRAVGQCLFDLAAEKPASQSRLWCLQISPLRGLVLVPNGEGSSKFRRVGLFRLTDHGAWFEGCSMLDIMIL